MEYEYKLYVGTSRPLSEVAEVVKRHVDGATITRGLGLWQGETEVSVVITLIEPIEWIRIVAGLAEALRARFNQDTVLITRTEVNVSNADKEVPYC